MCISMKKLFKKLAKWLGFYCYDYPMPAMTVDIVLCAEGDVLFIERGGEPFKGCLALPGGYMEINETLVGAAQRELYEETSIWLGKKHFEYKFIADRIDRDSRGRVLSGVFFVYLFKKPEVKSGDDAKNFKWINWESVLHKEHELAFDHQEILERIFK